jgi:hypothetical protein
MRAFIGGLGIVLTPGRARRAVRGCRSSRACCRRITIRRRRTVSLLFAIHFLALSRTLSPARRGLESGLSDLGGLVSFVPTLSPSRDDRVTSARPIRSPLIRILCDGAADSVFNLLLCVQVRPVPLPAFKTVFWQQTPVRCSLDEHAPTSHTQHAAWRVLCPVHGLASV